MTSQKLHVIFIFQLLIFKGENVSLGDGVASTNHMFMAMAMEKIPLHFGWQITRKDVFFPMAIVYGL